MAGLILIADDDRDAVENVAKVLNVNGYKTIEAFSGADCLKKVISEKPDLIILDVMMETDTAGFEVINQIRSERQFSKYKNIKDIPIIIMSDIAQVTNSRFSLDDKENFLPGNNSFLAKPVSFDVLIKKINELI